MGLIESLWNCFVSQHQIQWLGRGAKKHVDAFGSHLFYDLFVQGLGGHGPLGTPLDPLLYLPVYPLFQPWLFSSLESMFNKVSFKVGCLYLYLYSQYSWEHTPST